MTTDNDQATVDRLCLLTYTSDQEGEPHDCVECADAARAIIDAIRKGEVPGVVTDDMIQTTKLMVYEAALEEIVALRAEVAELKRELQKDWEANCCDLMADAQREKARADKAEAAKDRSDEWCVEVMRRLCDAAGVDVVALWQEEPGIGDMEVEIRRIRDADTRERDRLAGLLGDAFRVVDVVADGHTFDQMGAADIAARIAAALAEIGGVK